MYKWTENTFDGFHEYQLFYQVWSPPKSRGLLVITHGQGEHSECYKRLIEALKPLKWTILAWDLRGHGRSEGQRGYAAHFLDYVRDFEMLWSHVLPEFPAGLPRVFWGHSMGGLITLKALAGVFGGESQHMILSNPLLGLTVPVPIYKQVAAQLLADKLPRATLGNEIQNQDLTRDASIIDEYEKDILRHSKISPGVYLGALETIPSVLLRADQWIGKLLLLAADPDPIVSTTASLQFYDLAKNADKSLAKFSGHKHELINDLDRELVFEKVSAFLSSIALKKSI